MRRAAPYFIVFLLGFVFCAWVIYHFYGVPTRQGVVAAMDSPRGGLNVARPGSNQIRDAAKLVSDYVVNIDTVGRPQQGFPGFFGLPFGEPPKGQASGVVFTPDGYILTNNHVVEGAARLTVTLNSGKQYAARLVGRDPRTDLAVVKIDGRGLSYAKFGNSDTIEVGDWVIAVGSALGYKSTVTVGVVSAKREPNEIGENIASEGIIQTDASINRGNSGGALSDIDGNLVGINTAIASTGPGGGSVGIGFAIPSNTVRRVADQIIEHGKVIRPWLGIRYAGLNDEVRALLKERGVSNLPRQDGALVIEVYNGSPASEAGLQPQDVILKFNGQRIAGTSKPGRGEISLGDAISKVKVGDRVTMEVWHAEDGRIGMVGVRVAQAPPDFETRQ